MICKQCSTSWSFWCRSGSDFPFWCRFRSGSFHTLFWIRKFLGPLMPIRIRIYILMPIQIRILPQCSGSVSFWVPRSVSQRYGFGYGSFHRQAKIVRKTLIICTLFWLFYDLLSLMNGVNVRTVPLKRTKQKKRFLVASWRSLSKRAGSRAKSGSVSRRYGLGTLLSQVLHMLENHCLNSQQCQFLVIVMGVIILNILVLKFSGKGIVWLHIWFKWIRFRI